MLQLTAILLLGSDPGVIRNPKDLYKAPYILDMPDDLPEPTTDPEGGAWLPEAYRHELARRIAACMDLPDLFQGRLDEIVKVHDLEKEMVKLGTIAEERARHVSRALGKEADKPGLPEWLRVTLYSIGIVAVAGVGFVVGWVVHDSVNRFPSAAF